MLLEDFIVQLHKYVLVVNGVLDRAVIHRGTPYIISANTSLANEEQCWTLQELSVLKHFFVLVFFMCMFKCQKLTFNHRVICDLSIYLSCISLVCFAHHHNISVCLRACASLHRSRWDRHDQISHLLEKTQGGGKLKAIKKERANEDRSNYCQPDAWQGGNKPSVQIYSYTQMQFQRTHKCRAEPAVLTEKMAHSLRWALQSKRDFRVSFQNVHNMHKSLPLFWEGRKIYWHAF